MFERITRKYANGYKAITGSLHRFKSPKVLIMEFPQRIDVKQYDRQSFNFSSGDV